MKTNLVKSNSFLIILIKSLVICLSFWFIYHRIFVSQDFLQFQTTIKTAYLAKSFFPLFILVFILFLINWSTEAIKWRMLLQKLQKISFSESFKAVFSGITIGLFTPNRIGEYGGRIIYLDRDKRLDAVVNNVAGNFSQLLITLVFGVFGVIFYFFNFNNLNYGNKSMILLLFIPLVVILFFNINKIPALFG
ncbi:MAG: lysylphosphatidylglycerol synthase domain-containing protein, partial [Bacteroidota bacterium]|nr:lysylphosphatidylglycerol synthase domain-containing protein [Bacteroidota bacterium]